ncbi:LysR family transcriptional regulator [Rhizobium sp. BT-226]|uniref:LysR family transcriptional regulator n=1 Tax=Rhizobium sp. BT-226 TaxID=2986922 RepID=UPI0021F6C13E|nr:LysR family transcriptional regulator [Rhizobium sp. BT-226]MCW0021350.1 LysR family transcriptional regulator [Rhizobium sp. BT-226]
MALDEASRAMELAAQEVPDVAPACSLSEVDINLLVALDALLACRNVTYAARRVGQTQPAMSRLLGRLRDLLGDDLLVRGSAGLRLTTRAEYLVELVPLAMSQARGIIGTEGEAADARITIDANLMPALLPHFAKSSNLAGRRLKISSHRLASDAATQLRSRIVDFVLGPVVEDGDDIGNEIACSEDFVTLVAFGHHRLSGIRLALDAFLAMEHINLVDTGGEMFPQIADTLSGHGVHRSNMVEIPDVASAASMVSQGRLALTVPRSMAGWLARTLPLSALLPPIAIPGHEIRISWLVGDQGGSRPPLIDVIATVTGEAIGEYQAAVRMPSSVGAGEPQ